MAKTSNSILRQRHFDFMPSHYFMPNHVGVIMDGNRRYAKKQELESFFGHRRGGNTAAKLLKWSYQFNIKHLTLYTFSIDNFCRDESEKDYIFNLLNNFLEFYTEDDTLNKRSIFVRVIGDMSLLPEYLVLKIQEIEEKTKNNDLMFLNIAFAYGGKEDIANAFNLCAEKEKLDEDADLSLIQNYIGENLFNGISPQSPKIDLLIRTGGEYRMSNFLPWQASGNKAVFYSTEKLWPQFSKYDFLFAIQRYKQIVSLNRKYLKKREKLLNEYISDNSSFI